MPHYTHTDIYIYIYLVSQCPYQVENKYCESISLVTKKFYTFIQNIVIVFQQRKFWFILHESFAFIFDPSGKTIHLILFCFSFTETFCVV